MSAQNRQKQSLRVTSSSIQDINRALTLIERRLDQLEGIGQNPGFNGAKLTKIRMGKGDQAVTSEGLASDLSAVYDALSKVLNLDEPSGLQSTAKGLKVKARVSGGILLDSDGLSILVDSTGAIELVKAGLRVKLKSGYGIEADSDGLKLKKQSAIADPAAVSSLSLAAGADSVDMASFNTALSTLVSEINALKDKVVAILAALSAAEVIA